MARGPGHTGLGIATADLDSWRKRLQDHGAPIEQEAIWKDGRRCLYIQDPASNPLRLVTPGVAGLCSGWEGLARP